MKKKLLILIAALCSLLFALSACGESGAEKPAPADPSKILVAYFSATHHTEGVAEKIAQATGGTLHEIVPETPYTAEDLDYNSDCRANAEQRDPSSRPAIQGSVENMAEYDVLFLGYPIWWGEAPKIIYTFLEEYDLTGKTVVPFCTSGSSGIGSSAQHLHALAEGANWLEGKRFPQDASESAVGEWIASLGLKPAAGDPEEKTESGTMTDTIYLTIGDREIAVKLEKNAAADALLELLRESDITYTAHGYGGFEMVGALGHSLPRSDERMTAEAGDVILYSGDQIVLFYGSNTWSYTKLGKMQDVSSGEIEELLTAADGIAVTIGLK